ncbi:hypothetical protein MYX76_00895 [Desulfobacterota bacterium AH_259_B03_O07]|nr:hypothetical protein [Desulfobacterota bacterium AH_259_B03_O07]
MNNKPVPTNQKDLKLSDFPPILRKVLKYKLDNGQEVITFKGICNKLNINFDSFKANKWKYANKYNKDLDLYLDEHRMDVIKRGTFDTYQSITLQAQEGKLGQQKLVAELRGDIRNKLEIDHKVTGLFACFSPNPNVMPKDIEEKRKEMKPNGVQIIDIDLDD